MGNINGERSIGFGMNLKPILDGERLAGVPLPEIATIANRMESVNPFRPVVAVSLRSAQETATLKQSVEQVLVACTGKKRLNQRRKRSNGFGRW